MEYLITFTEGVITFISPCLLPLLPVYISYFTGQDNENNALVNALGFVTGFTVVFVSLGLFAGAAGSFLSNYGVAVNIILGSIVILFGLNIIGIINIRFLNTNHRLNLGFVGLGFFSSMLLGIVFSIGWTPCVGAFLGSALLLAASADSALKGFLMLLCYSLGLGLPFIAAAVLIKQLKSTFDFFKKHQKTVSTISGVMLIVLGFLMITGWMDLLLSAFSI